MRLLKITLITLLSFFIFTSPKTFASHHHHQPTFILIHGALFTSQSWIAVQSQLQNAGYNIVTVDVPGRAGDGIPPAQVTLDQAADKVCKVAALQKGKVILVGHSQGGAIITQALNNCAPKIKALVYVAAVAPLNGEMTFQDLSQQDNDNFDKCAFLDSEQKVFKINDKGPIKEMFMADASADAAQRAIHNMVPEPSSLGEATLHYPEAVFNAMPKFYLETLQDNIISPASQEKIINKIHPRKIYTLNTSHSPFLSQARLLSQYLIEIAGML